MANKSAPTCDHVAATGQQSGQTVVINFVQPLVTQQQIGKGVHDALKAVDGTGHRRARGV
jgi:hypothetical protein